MEALMLEKTPRPLGEALRGARAGMDKLTCRSEAFLDIPRSITLESPAFADRSAIPARFTADGEGRSPPLAWRNLPADAVTLALLVEDPDAPSPSPLVHALAWDLPAREGGLAEGELKGPAGEGREHELGRNSFLKAEYLPPDPPTGHGPHRYVFQLYALDRRLDLEGSPGRGKLVEAMSGHVLAIGELFGLYERA
jgi:hypothetical protein